MFGAGGEIRTPKTQGLSLICIPLPSRPQTKKQAVHCCGCPLFANNYFSSWRGWAYQPDACHLLLQFFFHKKKRIVWLLFHYQLLTGSSYPSHNGPLPASVNSAILRNSGMSYLNYSSMFVVKVKERLLQSGHMPNFLLAVSK